MKIIINNSISSIPDLTSEHYKSLRQVLSYKVPGSYYTMDPNGGIRYLVDKKGTFATGLLPRVLAWCKSSKLYPQLEDTRTVPKSLLWALAAKIDFPPYSVQLEAAAACFKSHRGIVQAPTGCGKSVMIALTIQVLSVKTLVVVPSLELKRQLTESLTQTFGRPAFKKYITVANVQSLDPKKPLKGYDCVIIDEYHHSAAKSYRDLNKYAWNDVYYRFGFTATPFRGNDEEETLLESVISGVIYQVPYQLAVDRGHIVPLEAYYVEIPKTEVKGRTWAQVYKELVVSNDVRNDIIQRLIISLKESASSTLCLVKEVAHGEAFEHLAPFAHGMNQDTGGLLERFNRGATVLVGTTGILGEGVDTKPCEYVILAGLGKSRPALMQMFGRCFRTYPGKQSGKVIIFYDKSHKWAKAHFKEQCRILKEEYGCVPVKLNLD